MGSIPANSSPVKRWTIRLQLVTPSLNEIQGQHWSWIKRHNATTAWALVSALNKLPQIPRPTGKRRITIERHGKGRLDADNLAGGCKGLIDAVRYQRLILDDDVASVELVFRQIVTRKELPHTLLIIEDVPEVA